MINKKLGPQDCIIHKSKGCKLYLKYYCQPCKDAVGEGGSAKTACMACREVEKRGDGDILHVQNVVKSYKFSDDAIKYKKYLKKVGDRRIKK